MAYCTTDEVSAFTGEVLTFEQEAYLEECLEMIEEAIDDLIEDYGMLPTDVTDKRKRRVSLLMGANALTQYQIDPSVISSTLTSGDTSESETRTAGGGISRITRIEPAYLRMLRLKTIQLANLRTETRWN